MNVRITRHFATVVGARQVHYRRAGSGPPVLLLHQSPASSREYVQLMRDIANLGHTVIAPDTPGNGLSESLPALDVPVMEDFADAVAGLMTELGIERAPVYGFHTGGVCALALGLRHPDRITVVVMDGYVQFSDAERKEILAHYLPPLEYDWSGSHLTWIWARLREQAIFFPWYRKDTGSRLDFDLPPPAVIHEWAMELMRAGDSYRKAYRAAFTFDCVDAAARTRARTVITTARTDVLSACMDALPRLPDNVSTRRPETAAASRAEVIEILREGRSAQETLAATPTRPMSGRLWADFLQTAEASVYCRRSTEASGRLVLMIHPDLESSHAMDRFMRPLIGKRPLLAVDLAGNGESDAPAGRTLTIESQAAMLGEALDAAGYREVDIFAHGDNACIGVELAIRRPQLVKRLAIPTWIPSVDESAADSLTQRFPHIEIDEYGVHLVRAWHMLRDQQLFRPWYRRTRDCIRRDREPDIAADVLQRCLLAFFEAIETYPRSQQERLRYPLLSRLATVDCPVLVDGTDPLRWASMSAVARQPVRCRFPLKFDAAAAALLSFFNADEAGALVAGSQVSRNHLEQFATEEPGL